MEIIITQTVKTVGWAEAMKTAPSEVISRAKTLSDAGTPVCIGQLHESTGNDWVVVQMWPSPKVVLQTPQQPISIPSAT